MAAVAAVGASYAQVSITGSLSAATQKNLAGTSKGLAMTDNTLVVGVSEDLGSGMKLSASMVIENDTARGTYWDRGDQVVTLTTPAYVLTFANTRSGGNQGAALVAPANLADDQWTSKVITREAIDAFALTVPFSSALSASYKYVEGKILTAIPAAYGTAGVTIADGYAGATTPGSVTHVLGAKYSANGLTVVGQFNSSTFSDALALLTASANGGNNTRTTSTDLSVVYNAGVATLGFGYDSPRRGKPDADAAATLLGVSVPFGAATVGVNWGKRDAASFMQVAAQYDLSKRTNVNLSLGNDTQSGTSGTTDQYRLSLNHSF